MSEYVVQYIDPKSGEVLTKTFAGDQRDFEKNVEQMMREGVDVIFRGNREDYDKKLASEKEETAQGTAGYDNAKEVTNKEPDEEERISYEDPIFTNLSDEINTCLKVLSYIDDKLSNMFGSTASSLDNTSSDVQNFFSIAEALKDGIDLNVRSPEMQNFLADFTAVLGASSEYLTHMKNISSLTKQIKSYGGDPNNAIKDYKDNYKVLLNGLDPLNRFQQEVEKIVDPSLFNEVDDKGLAAVAEKDRAHETGSPFEKEIIDQSLLIETFERMFKQQEARLKAEEEEARKAAAAAAEAARIAAEEEARRDDPPLDEEVEIVEDEGDGSSADGVEEANIVETDEEEEAQELSELQSTTTGEDVIGEEEQLDFAVPDEPTKLSPEDYLDVLNSTNPTLSSGNSFDSIINELLENNDNGTSAQRFLLPFSNLPEFKEMPSPSLISLDLPEPVVNFEESRFVYNYFTPDEEDNSLKPNARQSADFDDVEAIENELISKFALPPRYNIVKFGSTKVKNNFLDSDEGTSDSRPLSILTSFLEENNIIQDIKNGSQIGEARILTEGGLSSGKYSGSELINTDLQSRALNNIFNILNMEANTNINPITNNSESFKTSSIGSLIDSYQNRKDFTGEQGNIISSFLKGLTRGVDLPSTEEISTNKTTTDFLKFASFTMTFDNASFDDIIMSSDLEFGGLFENELDEYRAFSKGFYEKAKSNYTSVIDANAYEETIPQSAILAFAAYEEDQLDENTGLLRPSIEHAGYVVEKIQVARSGLTEQLEPIFLSREASSLVDLDVLYGYDYIYKIRTLAILEYDFLIPNINDDASAQFARGAFLISSRSNPIRIRCEENVPPKHPDVVRFKYDYERNYLDLDWIYPHNPQEDLAGFEIFRRSSIDEPFELIGLYNFAHKQRPLKHNGEASVDARKIFKFDNPNTTFTDINFKKKSKFIYAVASIDAHGMTSGYSPQYEVSFDSYTNQIVVKLVSAGGAPKPYPNYFFKDKFIKTFNEVAKTSLKNRLTVCFNPKYYDLKEGTESEDGVTERLGLIAKSKENDRNYIVNVNNIDLSIGTNINISINDRSVQNESFEQGILQKENLSFTFKNNE